MSRISRRKPVKRVTGVVPGVGARDIRRARGPWVWVLVSAAVIAGGTGAAFSLLGRPDASPTDKKGHSPELPSEAETGHMVRVRGGTFTMGSDEDRSLECEANACCGKKDALPLHAVELSDFWMDETPVTNAQFARFVAATGYVTRAERSEDELGRGGIVFRPRPGITSLKNHMQWWVFVPGADWRHPEGPRSGIDGKEDHPVVQVTYDDALAYCAWAGKRLPTEAEFEYAARGGLHQKRYAWGDELRPDGKWMANIWQGKFPYENTQADGFATTAPVKSFAANGYGLYDMSGNVWQWCADWYRPDYYEQSPRLNPQGPDDSFDPAESVAAPGDPAKRELRLDPRTGQPVVKRVQRGGSFLCSDMYCKGYLPGSRGKAEPDSPTNHAGFRCVR